MPRQTRAERQAQTRTELIGAAQRLFLDRGYAATSVDDVAAAAGYTKGAVYSNFQDKRHLCRAVLDAIHHQKLDELSSIATADGTIEERADTLIAWVESTIGDVGWTMVEMEFAILSRTDPETATMISSLRNDAQDMVTAALASMLAGLGVREADIEALPISLDGISNLLLSTGIGLGVQRAVDPAVSTAPATEAIRGLVSIVTSLVPTLGTMRTAEISDQGAIHAASDRSDH